MKTKVVEILDGLNVPYANGSIMLDAADIEQAFNLDEELTIKEFLVVDSLKKVGGEITKTIAENNLSKVALFVVVADMKMEEFTGLIDRIDEQEPYLIWGAYEPNEGEPNRVVAIMQ